MEIVDYEQLLSIARNTPYQSWIEPLIDKSKQRITDLNHGDLPRWLNTLSQLPNIEAKNINFNADAITVNTDISPTTRDIIKKHLMALRPWRKGPYHIHGVDIDTEWRSNLKWARLSQAITPLHDRHVLDVGCGNGYYLWRMLGAGAKSAIGIDPGLLLGVQFRTVHHFVGKQPIAMLPLGIEHLDYEPVFDTVFSMGVIYHRRNPVEHLQQLASLLRPGGELALETLIIDGDDAQPLRPAERYAQMRNVWVVPSLSVLNQWLDQAGFDNKQLVDINTTTTNEQRTTEWMPFHSLTNFLDPENVGKTIEGYPAPVRAIMIATKPA